MLCLNRRINEKIYIFPDDLPPDMTIAELFSEGKITIEVLAIEPDQVRIGIKAPKTLKVLRDNAKNKINSQATSSKG